MPQYGEQHHNAKLTYEQVRAIHDLADGKTKDAGWRQLRASLAAQYTVSIHTIERIAVGTSWAKRK